MSDGKCRQCGGAIGESASVCPHCGAAVAVVDAAVHAAPGARRASSANDDRLGPWVGAFVVIALLVSGGIITRYRHNRVEVVHAAEIFRDASIAGEDGAEAVERRRDFARRVEQSYRDEGKEFVITVQGDDATGLHMQSAEIDPVWKHQVSENYGLQTTLKDLGFNWLEATNGGDFSGHWDLE